MGQRKENIEISSVLENFITPLTKEEFYQLEENIKIEGCLEPLLVWENKGKLILVDGHNRLKICKKNNKSYKIRKKKFLNIDQVKEYMIENQLGRRNLNPDQLSYYRGQKYLALKKNWGGVNYKKSTGQNVQLTSELLAKAFKVNEKTIRRDAKYALGIDVIKKSNQKLAIQILHGDTKVKKADVQILKETKHVFKIKNEADLYNKAKIIREELVEKVNQKIKELKSEKLQMSQQILTEKEPLFLEKEDKISKIKGEIISTINKTIKEKDRKAVDKLIKLIKKLELVVFSDPMPGKLKI